jgi:protein kinase C substrate 80K-H
MGRCWQRRTGRRDALRCSSIGWFGRLVAAAALAAAAAAGAQARADGAALVGVDPEDETYRSLKPGDTFICSDGSVAAVPFERLNDGFCDCRDGSDEPGTGVCQGDGGRFFCPNTGFEPQRLFASRVNDGICDCCDGSDEYDSEARCSNTCAEKAAKWNAEADAWAAVVAAGMVAKQSYIEEASEAFATLKKHLRDIGRHIKEQTACAAAHAAAAAEEQGTALQPDTEDDEADDGGNDSTGGDKGAVALDASCELDEKRLEMLLDKQKELRSHITVFGPDFAWYPLAQKCVEFNNTQSGEYIYGAQLVEYTFPCVLYLLYSLNFLSNAVHSAQLCALSTKSCRPSPTAATLSSWDNFSDGRKEPNRSEK